MLSTKILGATFLLLLACMPQVVLAAGVQDAWGGRTISSSIPPRLVSPANGVVLSTSTPTLQWDNELPATEFWIQIDDDPSFGSPVVDQTTTARQFTPNLSDGTWYWRVKQRRVTPGYEYLGGAISAWSATWSFVISTGAGQTTITTTLSITPASFDVLAGGSKSLIATLRDGEGNPLAGKTLTWSTSVGQLSAHTATTDSNGQASVIFYAPSVSENTEVQITALFAGDANYTSSSTQANGMVVALIPSILTEQVQQVMEDLQIQQLSEKLDVLRQAFENRWVGGVVDLLTDTAEIVFRETDVQADVKQVVKGRRIDVEVKAGGARSFIFNIGSEVLPAKLEVLVDNEPIETASDYADVLNPSDENVPEYLVVRGKSGVQVLISIPSFSTRVISIVASAGGLPLHVVVVAVVVLLLAAGVAVKRKPKAAPPAEPGAGPQAGKRCPSCGRINSPQAKFCGYCGRKLEAEPEQPLPAEPAQAEQQQEVQ